MEAMPTPRRLNRQRVLETALRIADAEGLSGLTMRRLAGELDVEAMSLYKHVPGKEAILDGLVEQLMTEMDVRPDGNDPVAGLTVLAHAYRRTALRHPLVFPLLATRRLTAPAGRRVIDTALRLIVAAGLDGTAAVEFYRVLASYITGFALLDTAQAPGSAQEPDLSDAPTLAALAPAIAAADADHAFADGLARLLADLHQQDRPAVTVRP
jgi:TetR/AcrR family tetracycline transcriptional repressor